MSKITIGDAQLEYRKEGDGDPVLLVHGSASDYRTWHYQQDAFSKQYLTISYSRRYHWPNEPIQEGEDYSMALQVDDLQKVIQSLDSAPIHLIGHSYGAFLCMLLTIREPQLVKTLVLLEPPAITLFVSNEPKPLEIFKLLITRPGAAFALVKFGANGVVPAKKALLKGNTEGGIRKFAEAVFGPGAFDHFSPANRSSLLDNSANIRAELLGSGFLPVDIKRLQKLQMPTLLITGQRSIPLFRHLTDRLEELIPNTERIEIPGASHMMQVDNPEAFNRAVLSFLAKHA